MTTQLIRLPYHLPRDGGTALWHLGALLTFTATSEQISIRRWAKDRSAPRAEHGVAVVGPLPAPTTGGVGAVRRLGRRPLYTLETITEFERPHRMSYTVAGLPVRDYRCTVELAPQGGGTEIRWSGRFTAPGLVARPLRALLRHTVGRFAEAAAAAATARPHLPG